MISDYTDDDEQIPSSQYQDFNLLDEWDSRGQQQ